MTELLCVFPGSLSTLYVSGVLQEGVWGRRQLSVRCFYSYNYTLTIKYVLISTKGEYRPSASSVTESKLTLVATRQGSESQRRAVETRKRLYLESS